MLTEDQRVIFRDVLDSNWDLKELQEAGKWTEALEKAKEHNSHIKRLKESMGEGNYNHFIEMGQKMFAPKSN